MYVYTSLNRWNNILLDKPEDSVRLAWALKYSALEPDIKSFDKGIDQETGENGDALSGGQRVRVSLAQILYQDPDIYLLDDILSALDSDVGEFIMKETILGVLSKKTVVMATHAMQYLKHMHRIYLIDEGKVQAIGTLEEISENSVFTNLMSLKAELSRKPATDGGSAVLELAGSVSREKEVKGETSEWRAGRVSDSILGEPVKDEVLQELMVPEDRERGVISLQTYLVFLRLFGGGFGLVSILVLYLIDHSLCHTHSTTGISNTSISRNSKHRSSKGHSNTIFGQFANFMSAQQCG